MSNTPSVMEAPVPSKVEAPPLLQRLRAFSLPGGEAAVRGWRGVALALRGEIRASPDARWMRFTAAQTIEATRSGFRWNARMHAGAFGVVALTVTDAFEHGHGWMARAAATSSSTSKSRMTAGPCPAARTGLASSGSGRWSRRGRAPTASRRSGRDSGFRAAWRRRGTWKAARSLTYVKR